MSEPSKSRHIIQYFQNLRHAAGHRSPPSAARASISLPRRTARATHASLWLLRARRFHLPGPNPPRPHRLRLFVVSWTSAPFPCSPTPCTLEAAEAAITSVSLAALKEDVLMTMLQALLDYLRGLDTAALGVQSPLIAAPPFVLHSPRRSSAPTPSMVMAPRHWLVVRPHLLGASTSHYRRTDLRSISQIGNSLEQICVTPTVINIRPASTKKLFSPGW